MICCEADEGWEKTGTGDGGVSDGTVPDKYIPEGTMSTEYVPDDTVLTREEGAWAEEDYAEDEAVDMQV